MTTEKKQRGRPQILPPTDFIKAYSEATDVEGVINNLTAYGEQLSEGQEKETFKAWLNKKTPQQLKQYVCTRTYLLRKKGLVFTNKNGEGQFKRGPFNYSRVAMDEVAEDDSEQIIFGDEPTVAKEQESHPVLNVV